MLIWKDAKQNKPKEQSSKVLLKISGESAPVVGYYGLHGWDISTVNIRAEDPFSNIVPAFDWWEVTHFAEIGKLP